MQALQKENELLSKSNAELTEQIAKLTEEAALLRQESEYQQTEVERLSKRCADLEGCKQESDALRKELEGLRPDAQAHKQLRENLGTIECEARKRAADLEMLTMARLEQVMTTFQSQYQDLMSTFNTAAAHVNSELRKVEVNLNQLPRALDQPDAELKELEKLLRNASKSAEKPSN